ncbi:low molecular weight protein-tyrosine-phosphatase [Streptomyces sp. MUM 16J]|uniref:low molecular weight protein-tyrosine-phosphatase n=1 Tax=Streptomyces sp. MUM 16J TaxID=2791988 RepID=UPI001F044ED6|nr:low molecular weight protein-tyrosine-phosphatase [Streptomyces sp. MUM 16J]MCH0560204.1 low molecular weight phosphotyrosine protein phosphatase [Streptomyces sp. MUM 16J]
MTYRVCFVCTGNICRSPMAESVFHTRVAEAGLAELVTVDSAGTGGWHEGEAADPRAASVLGEHGYGTEHIARQFQSSWFPRLDLVIALDTGHLKALRRHAPTEEDVRKIRLLRSFDPSAGDELDVPDPYYGGRDNFEECLEMVEAASTGLLAAVLAELEGRTA